MYERQKKSSKLPGRAGRPGGALRTSRKGEKKRNLSGHWIMNDKSRWGRREAVEEEEDAEPARKAHQRVYIRPPPSAEYSVATSIIKAIMKRAFALYSVSTIFLLRFCCLIFHPWEIYYRTVRFIHASRMLRDPPPLPYIDFRRQDGYCRMLHIHLEIRNSWTSRSLLLDGAHLILYCCRTNGFDYTVRQLMLLFYLRSFYR